MQMIAGRLSCATHQGNRLANSHVLAKLNKDFAAMIIEGGIAIIMQDDHANTRLPAAIASHNDCTTLYRVDGCT